ncbi:hypothetical protein WR25_24978 [Diploscapter pachys]|uniref:Protein inscuteable homologue C-terminal domain-containing protein n=1 Tax=Diploscapter pachys TaxID=2018661 RepID=A0A2A2LA08_9BILA|nr:hypothetical protein WR25_24978 [Diploscapter pachys]
MAVNRLVRHWDALEESDDFLDDKHKHPERTTLEPCQRQWLSELSLRVEHECQTILFAKSLLNEPHTQTQICHDPEQSKAELPSIEKSTKNSNSFKCSSLSASLSALNSPTRPQRRIGKFRSDAERQDKESGRFIYTDRPSLSTLDLLEACRFKENSFTSSFSNCDVSIKTGPDNSSTLFLNGEDECCSHAPQSCAPPSVRPCSHHQPTPSLSSSCHSSHSTGCPPPRLPGYRPPSASSSTHSHPLQRLVHSSLDSARLSVSSEPTVVLHKKPPSYDQLRIRIERNGSTRCVVDPSIPSSSTSTPIARKSNNLRHSIAVNHEDIEKADIPQEKTCNATTPSISASKTATESATLNSSINHSPSSPQSMNSDSSSVSVDSGQCSGDIAYTSQFSFCSSRDDKDDGTLVSHPAASAYQQQYETNILPSYARMASTMDHVLRTSSSIYTLLATPSIPATARDLLTKASVFIQLVENSPCAQQLPKYDINVVKMQISNLQKEANSTNQPIKTTNYFTIVLRKMIEQVLQLFGKIIARYLRDCGNRDRLVVIALEHLIHLSLFGDELSLEAIQAGTLTSLVKLIGQPATPAETTRLILRAMAVLCGVAKGCLSLLALGGLETVLQQLNSSSTPCAIEAAGLLTQLTNPQHSFVQLNHVEAILIRLLDLIDICNTGESLLLVSAALSNASLQDAIAVDILYKNNAIIRLINAYHQRDSSTIFVQEQIVTILSRLAARRYEEALCNQGAVPILLEMLTVTDPLHADYCRRIRYKAAICIGTIAATEIGLRTLYENQAYAILSHILEAENSVSNPLNMICTNIRSKLEAQYQVESAV